MVRPPVYGRRAPAVPPPGDVLDQGDDSWGVELDPVLQNQQNDVIWQRRVDSAAVDTLSGTTSTTAALLSPSAVRH